MESYYNAFFKLNYLKYISVRNLNIDRTVDVYFRNIAKYEKRLKKDLYDFTVDEILEYYKSVETISLEVLIGMNTQFKLYTEYAMQQGLVKDNQNHYIELDTTLFSTCVIKDPIKIITRKELLDILDSGLIKNISDKVIALAIFEGISGKDLVELTRLEVDNIYINRKFVRLCSGRKLKISNKLLVWCLESAGEYKFYSNNDLDKNRNCVDTDLHIIKRLRSVSSKMDSDYSRYRMVKRRLDSMIAVTGSKSFRIKTLCESGRLEMLRNMLGNGMPINQALQNTEMEYRYGKIYCMNTYLLKYGKFLISDEVEE